MQTSTRFKKYVLVILALAFVTSACAPSHSQIPPRSITPPPPSFEQNFALVVDPSVKESVSGYIAYNIPQTMKLDETATIELLVEPSVSSSEVTVQIPENDQKLNLTVYITPRMKVRLISPEPDAFFIQPMHDSAEQLISFTETTKWSWDIVAKKGGTHRLALVIDRLAIVNGVETWRSVDIHRSDMNVQISMAQRLLMWDWKVIVSSIITALLIPAFWRWLDQRKRRTKQLTKPKRQKKMAK